MSRFGEFVGIRHRGNAAGPPPSAVGGALRGQHRDGRPLTHDGAGWPLTGTPSQNDDRERIRSGPRIESSRAHDVGLVVGVEGGEVGDRFTQGLIAAQAVVSVGYPRASPQTTICNRRSGHRARCASHPGPPRPAQGLPGSRSGRTACRPATASPRRSTPHRGLRHGRQDPLPQPGSRPRTTPPRCCAAGRR
jgi:hypothetical protein